MNSVSSPSSTATTPAASSPVNTTSTATSTPASTASTTVAVSQSAQGNTTSSADAYNAAQCTAQKQALVTQANQTYLTWFGQWQNARKGIGACYSTNPVPVCDKQMSDLNVQWQNTLTAQFNALDAQLTSCAPTDRYFNDVSSVVSAPY